MGKNTKQERGSYYSRSFRSMLEKGVPALYIRNDFLHKLAYNKVLWVFKTDCGAYYSIPRMVRRNNSDEFIAEVKSWGLPDWGDFVLLKSKGETPESLANDYDDLTIYWYSGIDKVKWGKAVE